MADVATLGLTVDATGVVRGVGIATRELDRLGGRSDQAKLNVKGLQGALGSLATAAVGLPGPLGRVGQILGSFALGGGMMIAVTAGVAAVGAAWQALSRDAEDARRSSKAMADQLMGDSRRLSEYSRQALLVRQQTIEARRNELATAIANQGKPTSLHPDLSTPAGRFAFGAADAATRATFFFPTVKPEEAEKLYEYDRALREVTKAIRALDEAAKPRGGSAGSRGGGRLVELGPGVTDVELARAYARYLADAAALKQKLMGGLVDTTGFGGDGFQLDSNLFRADGGFAQLIARLEAKSNRDAALAGAGMGIGGAIVSQMPGPFGGIAQGALGGLAGGPAGIAAGAVQGLVSSLLNMGEAARQAADNARRLEQAMRSWVDAAEFELGRIGAGELAARNTSRDAAAQRGSLFGRGPMTAAEAEEEIRKLRVLGADPIADEKRRRLDEINRLEKELTEHRRREADEMERLATAYRNAPRGFFVEGYLRQLGANPQWESGGPPISQIPNAGPGRPGRIPPQIIVSPGAIVVTVHDPAAAAQQVAQGLQQIVLSYGGTGMTPSSALNFIAGVS